jgi:hypothetical protein
VRSFGYNVAALAALLFATSSAGAANPKGARCVASYEQAQVFRRAENLEAARAELLVCQETCPEAVQRDCARWLEEIGALVPTVRFTAQDASGALLRDVRVTEDGKIVAVRTDVPVEVSPGPHTFLFEEEGSQPVTVRVEIHAGEREHPVAVTMAAVAPVRRAPTAETHPRSVSRAPFVALAAVAGAAMVTAGVLAIKGLSDRSDLRATCAGHCSTDDVDAIRTTWWTAAALGAGGALAAGAAVLLWPRSVSRPSPVTVGISLGAASVGIALP